MPIHLQTRFSRYSTTRSTRRINTFVMVQARTNIKAMCLSVYGVKLWNSLSNNLRDCNSVTIFNLEKSEEILDFNLLATLLVYFILQLFLVFLCLQLCNNIARMIVEMIVSNRKLCIIHL